MPHKTHILLRDIFPLALPLFLLLLIVSGCTEIRLISDYDEETDRATTALQKKVEALVSDVEKNAGTPQAAYDKYESVYDDILVDLRTLQVRADSRPKNGIQVQQFAEVEKQLNLFEEAHREGISAAEIPAFKNGFNQSFKAILTLELAKKRGE